MAGFNAGDVAEGVFTLACVARFIFRDKHLVLKDIQKIVDDLIKARARTSNDTLKYSWNAPNLNPSIKDKINLTIRLAELNLEALIDSKVTSGSKMKPIIDAALHYANSNQLKEKANFIYSNNQVNVLDFISDGVSNQKGTKQDIYINISGPNGKTELNLSVSLKAGAVKQFGQIGGSQPEKQIDLWKQFGFDMPKSVLDEYTKFYANGAIKDAIKHSYEELAKKINSTKDYNVFKQNSQKPSLKKTIIHFMVGVEEDMILIQLNRESATYKPTKLQFPNIIVAKMKSSGSWPEIQITTKGDDNSEKDILRIRSKCENRTQYIRNYIEKGSDLHEMQKD